MSTGLLYILGVSLTCYVCNNKRQVCCELQSAAFHNILEIPPLKGTMKYDCFEARPATSAFKNVNRSVLHVFSAPIYNTSCAQWFFQNTAGHKETHSDAQNMGRQRRDEKSIVSKIRQYSFTRI